MTKAKTGNSQQKNTVGFGCPDIVSPHKFVVHIPRGTRGEIIILEDFGFQAPEEWSTTEIERLVLRREKWTPISQATKREFNQRLRHQKLKTGTWKVGENFVDRLLGKELLVLAWAVEHADKEKIPTAIANWLNLRPEERWWLFGMTANQAGGADDGELGWRVALRYALAESPQAEQSGKPHKKSRQQKNDGRQILLPINEE